MGVFTAMPQSYCGSFIPFLLLHIWQLPSSKFKSKNNIFFILIFFTWIKKQITFTIQKYNKFIRIQKLFTIEVHSPIPLYSHKPHNSKFIIIPHRTFSEGWAKDKRINSTIATYLLFWRDCATHFGKLSEFAKVFLPPIQNSKFRIQNSPPPKPIVFNDIVIANWKVITTFAVNKKQPLWLASNNYIYAYRETPLLLQHY